MLENVAPVDPEAALAALERVARITDGELSTTVLSRHIQLISSIAYDASLFERCTALLDSNCRLIAQETATRRKQQAYLRSSFSLFSQERMHPLSSVFRSLNRY